VLPLALIPWFELPDIQLGPVTIRSFGLLTALGILAGVRIGSTVARRDGLDAARLVDFSVIALGAGVLGGHLVHLVFYHPEELRDPLRILRVWEGLSSMGGLAGAVLAAAVWFRVKRLSFPPYGDAFALALAFGWGVARLGCFAVHDHPGLRSDLFFAVDFPGGPRLDQGLNEAVLLFALGGLLLALRRAGRLRGRLLPLLALLYGAGRFGLDFLRARPGDVPYADGRTFGLTFAQWFACGLVAWGAWRLARPLPPTQGGVAPRPAPGGHAA
jgi:phosphatidylglycerol:prolipoprotein diacylglycerol transferase